MLDASSTCSTSSSATPSSLFSLALLVLTAVPVIFLVGLLRARLARSAIGDLLVDLREPAEPGALRDALARALRDPSLELAYWVPEYEAYVGIDGEPLRAADATAASPRSSSAAARRSPRSSTTPRCRTSRSWSAPSPPRPGSRSRTSACRPTCAPA